MKKITNLEFEIILLIIILSLLCIFLGYKGFGGFVLGIIISVGLIEGLRKIFVKKDEK